jgi:hypothetical protein
VLDPFVLFLAVAAAWFVLRVLVRNWSARKLASGDLSVPGWAIANAGSWALMPLLTIPFIPDPDNRAILLLVAVVLFVFQSAILWYFQRAQRS